jgi:hypothetical protein|tara:strand:+ start:6281 stop:6625 length:345 start_codon:yes stop_codon:yes gene_type:complete
MAFSYNLTINQGATFTKTFTYKSGGNAVDLSTYTARMQIRTSYDASSTLVSLTSGASDITLASNGVITVTIAASVTTAMAAPNTGVYDLEIVASNGTVTRLLQGNVTISPEVTK